MISLTNASLKIHLALRPTDMRKSFQGLSEIVTEHLARGAIFAVVNGWRQNIRTGGRPKKRKKDHAP